MVFDGFVYSITRYYDTEPEEEMRAVAKEDKEQGENQSGAQHESVQIEEISQQEGLPAEQNTGSSSPQGDSVGVVGAVMGAAKSLFGGGKHDEEVCLLPLPTLLSLQSALTSAARLCK